MNYLQLCNAVLREINEVEITNVTSTRGIQTSVADFINKAQRDIINSEVEWPFTVVNQSFTTTAGTSEYDRESDAKTVDYDSFTIQESADTAERKLKYISFDEYLEKRNEADTNPDSSARALSEYVYTTPDNKIGLSPVPDKSTYTVRYYYYQTTTDMAANTDTPIIPERFHDVIVNRARYYAHMLRSDVQFSQLALRDYTDGLGRMRVELINRKDYMRLSNARYFTAESVCCEARRRTDARQGCVHASSGCRNPVAKLRAGHQRWLPPHQRLHQVRLESGWRLVGHHSRRTHLQRSGYRRTGYGSIQGVRQRLD